MLLNTAVQVLKIQLQSEDFVFNLHSGTFHHLNGEGVVVRVAQNSANVSKTHSSLSASGNKPSRRNGLFVKYAISVSVSGHRD